MPPYLLYFRTEECRGRPRKSKILAELVYWVHGRSKGCSGGGMDPTEESAASWAQKLGRRPKINSRNEKPTVPTDDVRNLKVVHDSLGELPEGHVEVLVLQDRPVTDDTEDALLSIRTAEDEAAKKRMAAVEQQKKRKFNAWEEDDLMVTGALRAAKSTILPKYDDDGERKVSSPFRNTKTLGQVMNHCATTTIPHDGGKAPTTPTDPDNASSRRRNIRRRIISFADNPTSTAEPQALNNAEYHATTTISLDDDDLQRSLTAQRRRNVKVNLAEARFDIPESAEQVKQGVVYSEAVDFISMVRPKVESLNGPISDAQEASSTVAIDNVQEREHEYRQPLLSLQSPVEREPLVRRGVAATLAFLAKLGIRPQLATEREPPTQRKMDASRFEHVKIEHYDAEGNRLDPKEAYKHLSHKFHGKTPGKAKIEKLQRKREIERKKQAASLGDTPLGIASALRQHQRSTGDTFIVLQQGKHAATLPKVDALETVIKAPPPPQGKSGGNGNGKPVDLAKRPRIFGMK